VIGPLDDGARVIVFNSACPSGYTHDDGYLLLGDSKTVDLSACLKAGEVNRFVIQHADDCAANGWLGPVALTITGQNPVGRAADTWGTLKIKYR